MIDTARCDQCGCPTADHIPFRYWWRAYWRHKLLRLINPILSRIDDTHPDW